MWCSCKYIILFSDGSVLCTPLQSQENSCIFGRVWILYEFEKNVKDVEKEMIWRTRGRRRRRVAVKWWRWISTRLCLPTRFTFGRYLCTDCRSLQSCFLDIEIKISFSSSKTYRERIFFRMKRRDWQTCQRMRQTFILSFVTRKEAIIASHTFSDSREFKLFVLWF